MVQEVIDRSWQAEARGEETKQFIKNIKHLTRRKVGAEEKIRVVLEGFRRDTPSGTSVAEKASIPPPTTPGSRTSWRPGRRG